MQEHLTLNQISRLLDMPYERVRYVIDQKLLPGQRHDGLADEMLSQASPGRGKPRTYTTFEAFGIGCATMMIGAGLRRRAVGDCLDLLCTKEKREKQQGRHVHEMRRVPLWRAFESRNEAMLEIGDRVNVRMYPSQDDGNPKLDFGWRQLGTGAELDGYRPWVVIGINIAKVRSCFD